METLKMLTLDTIPTALRREIFSFVWTEKTIFAMWKMYKENRVDFQWFTFHLHGFVNDNRKLVIVVTERLSFSRNLSTKLLTIFCRLKGVVCKKTLMDYYLRKDGLHTNVMWGLLTDVERDQFVVYVMPYLKGQADFSLE